ncbi:LCP family protein [Candidatus Shapirobacteria bacterium]|nr:LCP family protein [Candidatus Shapirobacteria bacterium]
MKSVVTPSLSREGDRGRIEDVKEGTEGWISKSKKITPYLIVVVLAIALAYFLVSFFQLKQVFVTATKPKNPTPTSVQPTPTLDPDRPVSILLLGYGGGTHDGGSLTDSIMLAEVRPHDQQVDLISIPRDLWVELPVGNTTPFFSKINAAYVIGSDDRRYPHKSAEFTGPAGGGEMAKTVVSQITGKKIDYFLAIDFQGFVKVIDQLGGIDLKVTRPLDDPFYPIDVGTTDICGKSAEEITAITATMSGEKLEHAFTCRYENLHFGVGTTHVDGATALKFARSRHAPNDGGDFNRATRQRQVIMAVKTKALTLNSFSKIFSIIKTLSYHVRTDLTPLVIESYLPRAVEFSNYKINSLPLTDKTVLKIDVSVDRQSILVPTGGIGQYDYIHQYLQNPSILTPTITPTPSPIIN